MAQRRQAPGMARRRPAPAGARGARVWMDPDEIVGDRPRLRPRPHGGVACRPRPPRARCRRFERGAEASTAIARRRRRVALRTSQRRASDAGRPTVRCRARSRLPAPAGSEGAPEVRRQPSRSDRPGEPAPLPHAHLEQRNRPVTGRESRPRAGRPGLRLQSGTGPAHGDAGIACRGRPRRRRTALRSTLRVSAATRSRGARGRAAWNQTGARSGSAEAGPRSEASSARSPACAPRSRGRRTDGVHLLDSWTGV